MAVSRENYQVTTTDPEGMQLRVNSVFQSISDRLDKIEGIRGEASIESDLDMNDNTIKNVDIAATDITADSMTVGNIMITGHIFFEGTDSGLVYGEISVEDNSTETTINTQGVAVQVTIFDTNNHSHHAAPDHTEDHIVIEKAGHYLVMVSASINSVSGASSRMEVTTKMNNGSINIVPHVDRNIDGGGGKSGVISMSGLTEFAVGDTVEIWIENESNAANYIVEDISLTVVMVGGV